MFLVFFVVLRHARLSPQLLFKIYLFIFFINSKIKKYIFPCRPYKNSITHVIILFVIIFSQLDEFFSSLFLNSGKTCIIFYFSLSFSAFFLSPFHSIFSEMIYFSVHARKPWGRFILNFSSLERLFFLDREYDTMLSPKILNISVLSNSKTFFWNHTYSTCCIFT